MEIYTEEKQLYIMNRTTDFYTSLKIIQRELYKTD